MMQAISGVQNTWAPEFVYDAERQTYLIFWSSVTSPAGHQRIWCAETSDFKSFSSPAILFDPGYTVIDATIVTHQGRYYMVYKDERGENRQGTDFKAMRVATAVDLRGPYTPQTNLITPHLTEGPTLYEYSGHWRMLSDCFLTTAGTRCNRTTCWSGKPRPACRPTRRAPWDRFYTRQRRDR